jgi:PAS domain S-box-containing protein
LTPLDFRQVLDAFADAVVACDGGGRLVYANAAAEKLLGWPGGALVGQPLGSIIPSRLRPLHEAGFARYLDTHTPRLIGRPIRVPVLHRDGIEIDVELSLAAFHEGGQDLVVAALRDLRERYELERQMRVTRYLRATTRAAVRLGSRLDLEHVLQTVVETLVADFDAALARVWLYDADANALRLRASAGLSRRTADSPRALLDVATYPYKVGEVARTRRPFVKNGLAGDPHFEQDWVAREGLAAVAAFPLLIAGDLRGVLVHFARQPLPDEVVECLGTFVSIITVTLNDVQLYEAAREAVRAREHFLSVASHELRTPLSPIQLQVQLLLRHARQGSLERVGPERVVAMLESCDRQVKQLTRLINDLLDVSRISAGRLELHLQEVDLAAAVRAAVARFGPEAAQAGCPLAVHAGGPVVGRWDPARLDQVVGNLLSNALKYGAGKPVELAVTAAGGTARLTVRDQGVGIAPEHQARIFERFERVVAGHTHTGLGLGLFIVRRVLEALGGSVRVTSTPGAGATFTVELPCTGPP